MTGIALHPCFKLVLDGHFRPYEFLQNCYSHNCFLTFHHPVQKYFNIFFQLFFGPARNIFPRSFLKTQIIYVETKNRFYGLLVGTAMLERPSKKVLKVKD